MTERDNSPVTVNTAESICDIVLRDGSTLALRPARESDAPAIVRFFEGLSPASLYQRFLGFPRLDAKSIARLVAAGAAGGAALVGESAGRIVAFAGYYPVDRHADRAEVAFAIADALQGRGIGTRLLERLADMARDQGIRRFDAFVLGENRRMMAVFLESGFETTSDVEQGMIHVRLELEATSTFLDKAAQRAQSAATASMKAFFEPGAVAVVGANRSRGKIGAEILHNVITAGFTGRIFPVHPTAPEIEGLPAYPRVADIPGPVDLAVVAVPAAQVLETVDDCLAKGVRGICVISAGFGEAGPEGRAREAQLLEKVRGAGCRLIGPNCMGLLNTDPAFSLNATFAPTHPPAGAVAMSSQSGALGLAILDYARRLNIGISSFVSVGNKVDVSSNDLIQYWSEDPRTSVILLYLESFGNPKKFSEIARRVGRTKPIVAVKAGRSAAGTRAASSHTGALAATDTVVDALFRQAGVIRTQTLEEMFDVAALLAHQPVPKGRRVAVLTNAGGPGILAADACEANGLELPLLGAATTAALRSFLPAASSVSNPVDMLASAPPEHYRLALRALLADDNIDSVVAIFIPPLVTDAAAVADEIAGAARGANGKPVVAVFMQSAGAPASLAGIPCYAFPEGAARALARVTAYGEWRHKPVSRPPALPNFRVDQVRWIVDRALAGGGGWLTPDDAQGLMTAAGIRTAAARLTTTIDDAVAAASEIGYPVALKAVGPTLLHKTERRAVCIDLRDARALRSAAEDLEARLQQDATGFLVQRMVPEGVEMFVGALQDRTFGPLVVCGTGGIYVDLLADSSFRLHPLTEADAVEMIEELRGVRLLRGYRGAPPADEAALADVLLRVSALIAICPEIQEMDLNPVKVQRSGARAVDVRVRVELPRPPSNARRVQY